MTKLLGSLCSLAVALAATAALAGHTAHAATTFVVDSLGDDSDPTPNGSACFHAPLTHCTLRSAIQNANGFLATAPVTITLIAGDYTPATPYDNLTRAASIGGPGDPANTRISGSGTLEPFTFSPSAASVTVSGITIHDGQAANGGAVLNGTALTIRNSVLHHNHATASGGAIYATGAGASVSLDNVTLNNNTAQGGAAINLASASLTMANSHLLSNQAGSSGYVSAGAIAAGGAAAITVTNSVLQDNTATSTGSSAVGAAIGTSGAGIAVTVSGSTLTHNVANGSAVGAGGAVYNAAGPTTITNSTINNNMAVANTATAFGGGIESKTLSVSGSTIAGNQATSTSGEARGGGIYINTVAGGSLAITSTALSGNSVSAVASIARGGAVDTENLPFTVASSTFSGNTSTGGTASSSGGAFFGFPASASSISGSTFTGNTSNKNGGAISLANVGPTALTSDTLTANSASLQGGAVYSLAGSAAALNIGSATIAGNTAATGSGLFGPGTLKDTILSGSNCASGGSTAVSAGHNLETGNTCNLTQPSDRHDAPTALLGALAANGGPTHTMALMNGSPAIDTGGTPGTDCPAADQRGMPRSGPCDIGAYELQYTTPTGSFRPLTPYRVFDSRPENGGGGPLGPGASVNIQVTGTSGSGGGVPASGVGAVALNVTAVSPSGASFLALYPAGTSRPVVSNLNLGQGTTIANLVEVPLGTGGQVAIYNDQGTVQVVVDVEGWYTLTPQSNTNGLFRPLSVPNRLLDTRPGTQVGVYGTPFGPDTTRNLTVTGGEVAAARVSAVVLNVTGVAPSEGTYLTAFPAGAARPLASNVNIPPGRNLPNRVIATVGAGGQVSIYNAAGLVDVVIDILGWFTNGTDPSLSGGYYHALAPQRILDSRAASQVGPYNTPFGPGVTRAIPVAGQGNLPAAGIQAVVGNLTGVAASTGTFLTVWPTDAPGGRPTASDINLGTGDSIPNLAIVRVGADGKIDGYNDQGTTDVLFDSAGYYG